MIDNYVIISLFTSFFITVILVKLLIPVLKRLKFGQRILEIGPSWHVSKQGTPTMGGIGFLIAVLLTCILFALIFRDSFYLSILLSVMYALLNGMIGIVDDLTKIKRKQNEGLSASVKFLLQLIAASVYVIVMVGHGFISTEIYVPFVKISFDIGRLYYPFAIIFLCGFVNAVNLTDGLDGLCSSVTAAAVLFFALLAKSADEMSGLVLALSVLGACLGFLVFNYHPAKVFMGDTGSLFLGGAVSALALTCSKNTVLFIVGAVYLLEAISVILQVGYYKMTKKRLFLMAPFHHHLEKKGLGEVKITLLFSFLTLVLSVFAFLFA